jgi:hypothetical protein
VRGGIDRPTRWWIDFPTEEAAMNETIARLGAAVNRHDPEGMAACFAPDYRSEQPAHPNRAFGGAEQVAVNWTQLFAGVPDLAGEVIDHTMDGRTTWTEWEWRGHYPDGSLFHTRAGSFSWA